MPASQGHLCDVWVVLSGKYLGSPSQFRGCSAAISLWILGSLFYPESCKGLGSYAATIFPKHVLLLCPLASLTIIPRISPITPIAEDSAGDGSKINSQDEAHVVLVFSFCLFWPHCSQQCFQKTLLVKPHFKWVQRTLGSWQIDFRSSMEL